MQRKICRSIITTVGAVYDRAVIDRAYSRISADDDARLGQLGDQFLCIRSREPLGCQFGHQLIMRSLATREPVDQSLCGGVQFEDRSRRHQIQESPAGRRKGTKLTQMISARLGRDHLETSG